MGQLYSIKEETLKDIANSVRTVTGTTGDISVEEFAVKIVEGGVAALPELTNEGTAADLLSGKQLIDSDGEVVTGTIPTKTSSNLTASGATVTVPAGYYASQATKSVTTATRANTTMTTTADDTNDKLTITASNNQSTGYVTGSNKTATTTVTLTVSGATVTASDGSKSVSKSVATATQATPSVSIDSAGKITATATQTAGYVSAGTKTGTKQLTTQAAKTVTPTKSSQTAVAKDVYTTGVVTVGAIPNEYITTTDATAEAGEIMSGETAYVNGNKVTGTFTIDSELSTQDNLITQIQTALEGKAAAAPKLQEKTATPTTSSQTITPDSTYDGLSKVTVSAIPSTYVKPTTTKTATTYTPTTSNQTIAAGTYCSGIQTIKGDANLKAENIAEGVSIFGVTGTHSGGGSGGGSAPMIVSGKVASNISASSAAPTQSVVATVGGLGFKPFCVMLRATSTVTANASVTNYFIGCQYADGVRPLGFRLLTMSNGTTSVYTGDNMIAYVETTEDGFILYNGDFTNMYYPSQFDYIAIG